MHTSFRYCGLFVAIFSQTVVAQVAGVIRGTILDESGKPVTMAEIEIAQNKPFYGHRLVQKHESDSSGAYVIDNVPWGTYVVMAGKESDGYPDMRLAFYSNLSVPSVTLSPQYPVASVNLTLGPKAGFLSIPSVKDAVTGKKVQSAVITLKRSGSEFFIKTAVPAVRILIPSLTDVAVVVEAPGYRSWTPIQENNTGIVHLSPQQLLTLDVEMKPLNPIASDETPTAKPKHVPKLDGGSH